MLAFVRLTGDVVLETSAQRYCTRIEEQALTVQIFTLDMREASS